MKSIKVQIVCTGGEGGIRSSVSLCSLQRRGLPRYARSVLSNPRTWVHHVRQPNFIVFDLYIMPCWRTRMQPIRTISEIPVHINIIPIMQIPLYKKLSTKVKQLQTLGISYGKIAKELDISESTVLRAIKYHK